MSWESTSIDAKAIFLLGSKTMIRQKTNDVATSHSSMLLSEGVRKNSSTLYLTLRSTRELNKNTCRTDALMRSSKIYSPAYKNSAHLSRAKAMQNAVERHIEDDDKQLSRAKDANQQLQKESNTIKQIEQGIL